MMEEIFDKISEIKKEVESGLNISIPLWFEQSESKKEEDLSDSRIAAELAGMIDHTLLRPDADPGEADRLCRDAIKFGFYSVCVYAPFVPRCVSLLDRSEVKVCTVCGFPSGAHLSNVKAFEAAEAASLGADEIDMVINIAALKENRLSEVYDDISAVVIAVPKDVIVKVILETGYLTGAEKIKGCLLAKAAGAGFVKTSTGFGPSGASIEDVRLLRSVVGPDMGVKAAGGIRDAAGAMAMVKAGASRIGTSASISILSGLMRIMGPNCMRRGN
jgi:deoxyribose-phosphate aldolase